MLGCKNLRDRSVVIFVKYREISTRTILPNFIGHCKDSVAEGRQKREIEEAYVEEAYVRPVLSCFDILLANQGATKKALACSHSRSLQLLCTVGGNQARSDARKLLERSPMGSVFSRYEMFGYEGQFSQMTSQGLTT
jgi:hypothetical protein